MSDISYTRTGIIKKVGEKAIMIEMADTGESIVWPLHSNDEDSDISETLEVGEEITIEMHISDDPFQQKDITKEVSLNQNSPEEEAEAERMRKMLEELLN